MLSVIYRSIAEDEAMCGADLSDVENENMKDDQDNSQRKGPKKDMDDKTRAINSSHAFQR